MPSTSDAHVYATAAPLFVQAPCRLVIAIGELTGERTPAPDDGAASRTARRRRQSAAVREQARKAVALLAGCGPNEIDIVGGGSTAPAVAVMDAGGARSLLQLSLSHSEDWVAAVAGAGIDAVGIDVQTVRQRDVSRLGGFMGWMELLSASAASIDAFTQLWTLWEAAVKCDGTPLLAASTPAFAALAPGWSADRTGAWESGGYTAWSSQIAPCTWVSVVARGAVEPAFHVLNSTRRT